MTARILLIDDHQIMRDGIRLVLRGEPDFEIVGNAFDSESGWQAVLDLAPHLVIMDLDIPGEGGTALTARIRHKFPEIKVLILTGQLETRYVEAALRAGAQGCMFKTNGCVELLQALKAVLSGNSYLCPEVSTFVLRELQRQPSQSLNSHPALSTREIEVLREIANGHPTKEIAFRLGVSPKTIETHRVKLLTKLHLGSVAELTKYAVREGLTNL